jgi:hypothetical protein
MTLEIKRLSSGYWHIRGAGPCNWAQPPIWPSDEAVLRGHMFGQASEAFVKQCMGVSEWTR